VASFVHLAPAREAGRIRRDGVRVGRKAAGVFAMPVVADYMTTYNWSREMTRHRGRLVAVQFRIPDAEDVRLGHYTAPSEVVTAAQAVGIIREVPDARGFEVLIPRSISAGEVTHIRSAPRVGWRYSPTAKGTANALCPCPVCRTRGEVGEAAIRRNIIQSRLAPTSGSEREQLGGFAAAATVASELGERATARRMYRRVQTYTTSADPDVRRNAFDLLVQLAVSVGATQGLDPDQELTLLAEQLAGEHDDGLRALSVDASVARATLQLFDDAPLGNVLTVLDAVVHVWSDDPSPAVMQSVNEARESADEIRAELDEEKAPDQGGHR
jgi:hypothetical protein